MKPWLEQILANPENGSPLKLDTSDGLLHDAQNRTFSVDGDVPVFVEQKPMPENKFDYTSHYTADAEVFDYFAEETDSLQSKHLHLLRRTVTTCVPAQSKLLLDIGCGCAFVAKTFANSDKKIVSADIAIANAKKALQHYPAPNHAAIVADAYKLPFANNTFDCIVASEIIEHTIDPKAFVKALTDKLKPGGLLIISTPYKEKIAYSLCIHCNCKTPHNAHLHSFDKEKIKLLTNDLPVNIEKMQLVGNKAIIKLRIINLLYHLGYATWHWADRLANHILPRAEHFVITIRKTA